MADSGKPVNTRVNADIDAVHEVAAMGGPESRNDVPHPLQPEEPTTTESSPKDFPKKGTKTGGR